MDWLTARPVAHRGLHDAKTGLIENTPSAFRAAIAGNYAIECDLQLTADGEAIVYHDDVLGRLTDGESPLATMSASDLKRVRFKDTTDAMLTLGELCELAAGRVTLLLELKSRFNGERRLAERTAEVLAGYKGAVAVMSFDPQPMAVIRSLMPELTRGLVAQRRKRAPQDDHDASGRGGAGYAMHALASRPQFLAFRVQDLPAAGAFLAHNVLRLPLLAWTVRSADDRARAARWADQIIFEGFRPQ